jgi:hypothetical protein
MWWIHRCHEILYTTKQNNNIYDTHELLAIAMRYKKEIKGIQIGSGEVKWSQFADYRRVKRPYSSHQKLLDLVNIFSKVAEYKTSRFST